MCTVKHRKERISLRAHLRLDLHLAAEGNVAGVRSVAHEPLGRRPEGAVCGRLHLHSTDRFCQRKLQRESV